MAASPYGATQSTLLQYYKTCIRPILEYGSIVLCIACPTSLSRLESVQNTALKVALRLPQHAKTEMVLIEAGCPSVKDRIDSLAITSFSKFKASADTHPYFQGGKEMHSDPCFLGKQPLHERDLPLGMFLNSNSETIKVPTIPCIPYAFVNPLSPSTQSLVSFEFSKLEITKHTMTEIQKKELAVAIERDIEERYADHIHYYVDGSVDPIEGRASSAFTSHNIRPLVEKGVRITDNVSSTQAELAAIHLTLLHIATARTHPKLVVILCDSKSSITTLQRTTPDSLDQLSKDIWDTHEFLCKSREFKLTIHWIPSHIGIPGNERADAIATTARASQSIEYHVPTSLGQCKASIKRFFTNKTRTEMSKSAHPAIQRYMKLNPSLSTPKLTSSEPSIQLWINRLRLDVDTFCYIHECNMVCCYCDNKFTAQHYLSECPVTAHMTFTHMLSEEDHDQSAAEQHIIILQKASHAKSITIFSKYLFKTPPKFQCAHGGHGKIITNKIGIS